MPIYTYQIINEDGSDGPTIEVTHGMNEPPLTEDPETGKPVRRVFAAPHVAGWGNSRVGNQMTSDQNCERLGFTKAIIPASDMVMKKIKLLKAKLGTEAGAIGAALLALLEQPAWPPAASSVLAYVGEPVAIKEPSGIPFRRQSKPPANECGRW